MIRVLVATPINEGKEDLFEEFTYNLFKLGKDFKYLLVDNSKDADFGGYAGAFDHYTHFYLPRAFDRIAMARRIAKKVAVEMDYDYLLFIDSDVFPERKEIDKLIDSKLDIVSAMCMTLDQEGMPIPNAWIGGRPVDLRLNGIVEVDTVGFGCTLISKHALELSDFQVERKEGIVFTGEDFYFCKVAKNNGIRVFVNLDASVRHKIGEDHWDYDVD